MVDLMVRDEGRVCVSNNAGKDTGLYGRLVQQITWSFDRMPQNSPVRQHCPAVDVQPVE